MYSVVWEDILHVITLFMSYSYLDNINLQCNNNILYSSPNIVRVIKSRRMRWVGHVACRGEGRGVYRVLVGRPKGKRPLGRPRCTWEDNIMMDLRKIGINGVNWIQLAQDRV
jgi:hypothetical protein